MLLLLVLSQLYKDPFTKSRIEGEGGRGGRGLEVVLILHFRSFCGSKEKYELSFVNGEKASIVCALFCICHLSISGRTWIRPMCI